MSEDLIDWRQLDLITEECGEEIGPIFHDFLEDYASLSARITALAGEGDAAGIGKAAHQLKGSSSTFGMRRFAAVARGIELDAAERRILPTPETLRELAEAFDASVAAIQAERPRFAA